MTDTINAPLGGEVEATSSETRKGYLFGPIVDFMCLGGGSIFVIILLVVLASEDWRPFLVLFFYILSHFINNPHFMHSYQIFYDNFYEKAFGGSLPANLQRRYIIAGIVVPVTMTMFFAYGVFNQDARLLALSANAMYFLVGWHYVKQGYGMLIVESVLKRCFFSDLEKTWFRYNGFAVWLFSWIYANIKFAENDLFGLKYYTFEFPYWLAYLFGAAMVATTLTVITLIFLKCLRNGVRLPINGLLAYATSSYIWLIAVNLEPITLVLVPAFHSLQYLAVVWRYQLNKERASAGPDAPDLVLLSGSLRLSRPVLRLMRFVLIGTVVGVFAFWVVPILLSAGLPYDQDVFGVVLFVFISAIFINVHHYFLDNVMWRKENPDIKRHLFSSH